MAETPVAVDGTLDVARVDVPDAVGIPVALHAVEFIHSGLVFHPSDNVHGR